MRFVDTITAEQTTDLLISGHHVVALVLQRRVIAVFDFVLSEHLSFCHYLNVVPLIRQILRSSCLRLLVLEVFDLLDRRLPRLLDCGLLTSDQVHGMGVDIFRH